MIPSILADHNKYIYYLKNFSSELYVAFSLSTPDYIVNKYKIALQALKDSGEYKKIINKYK